METVSENTLEQLNHGHQLVQLGEMNEAANLAMVPATNDEIVRFELLKTLEYYFSAKNLSKDQYLVSQMDSETYVAIDEIAKFRKIRAYTLDIDLIKTIIRQSSQLELDPSETRVRSVNGAAGGSVSTLRRPPPPSLLPSSPSPQQQQQQQQQQQRSILILREVAPEATHEQVVGLFENREPLCAPCEKCESAGNELWYVTFSSEEQAQRALSYLKNELINFMGRPIKARIKSHVIPRSSTSLQGATTAITNGKQNSGLTLTPTSTPPPVQSPLIFSTSQLQSPTTTFISSSSPTSSVQTPNSNSYITTAATTALSPPAHIISAQPYAASPTTAYMTPPPPQLQQHVPPNTYIISGPQEISYDQSVMHPWSAPGRINPGQQIFYYNNPPIYSKPPDTNYIMMQMPHHQQSNTQPVMVINSMEQQPQPNVSNYATQSNRSGVFSQSDDSLNNSNGGTKPSVEATSTTPGNSPNNSTSKPATATNPQQQSNLSSGQSFKPFYGQSSTSQNNNSPGAQNSLSISVGLNQHSLPVPPPPESYSGGYYIQTGHTGPPQPGQSLPMPAYFNQFAAANSANHPQPPYFDFIQQPTQQPGDGKDGKNNVSTIQIPIPVPISSFPGGPPPTSQPPPPHTTLQIGSGNNNQMPPHQQQQQPHTILFYNSFQPGQHPTHNIIINPALMTAPSLAPTNQQQPNNNSGASANSISGGPQGQGPTSPKPPNAYPQYQPAFYHPHPHHPGTAAAVAAVAAATNYQARKNSNTNNNEGKPTPGLYSQASSSSGYKFQGNAAKNKYHQNKNYQGQQQNNSQYNSGGKNVFGGGGAYYNSPNNHLAHLGHHQSGNSGHHYNPNHHHNNNNNHHHPHQQHHNNQMAAAVAAAYPNNYPPIPQVYSVAYNAIPNVVSATTAPPTSVVNYDSNSSSGISTSSALSSTSHTPIRGNGATSAGLRSNGVESPECVEEVGSIYLINSSSSSPPQTTPSSQIPAMTSAPDVSPSDSSAADGCSTLPVKKSKEDQIQLQQQVALDPAIISISKSADSIPSSPTIIKSSNVFADVSGAAEHLKTSMPETIANILTLTTNTTDSKTG